MKDGYSIIEFLKYDQVQRLIYIGIVLLWIFVGVNFVKYKYDFSPFYFDIIYAMIIPTTIFALPIIFNKRPFWLLAFGFSLIHGIWSLYKIVLSGLSYYHSDYNPNLNWMAIDISTSIIVLTISFLVTWVIWKMKPNN